jgi:hypothetical protein
MAAPARISTFSPRQTRFSALAGQGNNSQRARAVGLVHDLPVGFRFNKGKTRAPVGGATRLGGLFLRLGGLHLPRENQQEGQGDNPTINGETVRLGSFFITPETGLQQKCWHKQVNFLKCVISPFLPPRKRARSGTRAGPPAAKRAIRRVRFNAEMRGHQKDS